MLTNLSLEKIFKTALKNGGDFSDIFFEETYQTLITADNNRIEKISTGTDTGIGLRVVYDSKTVYGYTNILTDKAVIELAESAAAAVKGKRWNQTFSLHPKQPEITYKIKIEPKSVSLEKKTDIVKEANKVAWNYDKKIKQASVSYKDTTRKIEIANSSGEIASDHKIDTVFFVMVVASDGKIIQTGYEPVGAYSGFEFFEEMRPEEVAKSACKRAITMLSARPAPAGTMPVVLSSEAGGTMVHEAVGHGLEADLAINGFSVYQNKIGQQVASKLITVIDDATVPGRRGSFSFDDEGINGQKTVLIEDGILKSYMHNRITALKSATAPTGNGRRESYRFKPVVRMTNTIIVPGNDDPDSIVKDTHRGLFVKKMGGGQVNTITGNFVFEVMEGYLIKDGAVTEPVRGATLTGNGPEVLTIIDRVGNDLGYAIGTCGKDSQGVPVGDAQPTLRIPEMIVGGTAS